ncbi:uncharacterized protein LOC110054824 [Orbicella faveolata]|uniref:uncharacterized protein LOC110054824 n=1 Tax=Orbicella faveolata TaxID=48498 RepID=UPI0009E60FAF|nr:uncharacterized protein LOC110054824 [Orbicella faveolata]
MAALRKIVLDPKWLSNLHFYVRFRHTEELENFNSMMTKYAPKRMAFEYVLVQSKISSDFLAAIDHNFHLFRKPKQSKEGDLVGHRKYSKRTQRYHAEVVKKDKAYAYFPYMVARMLHTERGFQGSFSAKNDVVEFDPKQIAPTLAMKATPSTEELMKAPSRFSLKPKVNGNIQE